MDSLERSNRSILDFRGNNHELPRGKKSNLKYRGKIEQVKVLEHKNVTLTVISAAASESASRNTISKLILADCKLSLYQHVLHLLIPITVQLFLYSYPLKQVCEASNRETRSDSFRSNIERTTFTLKNKALPIELTK